MPEGQVFHFELDPPDTHAVRQRREDVQSLLGDELLLFGRHVPQGAHVVQPVSQLDQDDPHILRHGKDHLAHVLRLLLKAVVHRQFLQFGHAFHQHENGRPEDISKFLTGDRRVLQHIVEQARRYSLNIQLQIREDQGDFIGVLEVGISRFAELSLVGALREVVSLFNEVHIGFWIVSYDAFYKVLQVHSAPLLPP